MEENSPKPTKGLRLVSACCVVLMCCKLGLRPLGAADWWGPESELALPLLPRHREEAGLGGQRRCFGVPS